MHAPQPESELQLHLLSPLSVPMEIQQMCLSWYMAGPPACCCPLALP